MERYVAFEGVSGTGEIACFCSLKEARKFIIETKESGQQCCLLSAKERNQKKFRSDNNEGHRYCCCTDE